MTRWVLLFSLVLPLTACGGRNNQSTSLAPSATASRDVDSLWMEAESAVRRGDWSDALKLLNRVVLELRPNDPRMIKARYYLAEAQMGQGNRLEAVREFRRVVDDAPDSDIAADALLRVGDAYSELWRRPELDPTYGQSALDAYTELTRAYPNTQAAARAQMKIADLRERFAYKTYRAAMYYVRLKAYDSAILYLKDLVANYPRTSVTPTALVQLVEAYGKLGYQENLQETCEYIRQYHAQDNIDAHCPKPSGDTPDSASS